jgi:hypothetical protein
MGTGEDPRERWRVRSAPSVRLLRCRHIDDLEEFTAVVEHGDRAVRAGVNADDGLGGH